MSEHEGDRQKAMAAVGALFAKYKLLAAKRTKGHVVSTTPRNYAVLGYADSAQDFDSQVMDSLELVDATPDGTVAFDMVMAPSFSNLNSMSWSLSPWNQIHVYALYIVPAWFESFSPHNHIYGPPT